MMAIQQRTLRKADDNVCNVCGTGGGAVQIEFAVPDTLLHETSDQSLSMLKAFLDYSAAKVEIGLKKLMAARRAVDDVGGCAVLRDDGGADSFGRRAFLCSSSLSKITRL